MTRPTEKCNLSLYHMREGKKKRHIFGFSPRRHFKGDRILSRHRCLRLALLVDFNVRNSAITTILGPVARAPDLGNAEALRAEDIVHIFQTPPGRFRVEEVGDWHERGVEDGPDDVEAILKVLDSGRGDPHDDSVRAPVGAHTQGDALVAGAEGHDFRGIHPRDGEDTEGEDVEEEEAESDEDPVGGQGVDVQHDGDHHHAEGAGGRGPDEHLSASDFFDEEVGAGSCVSSV